MKIRSNGAEFMHADTARRMDSFSPFCERAYRYKYP